MQPSRLIFFLPCLSPFSFAPRMKRGSVRDRALKAYLRLL